MFEYNACQEQGAQGKKENYTNFSCHVTSVTLQDLCRKSVSFAIGSDKTDNRRLTSKVQFLKVVREFVVMS